MFMKNLIFVLLMGLPMTGCFPAVEFKNIGTTSIITNVTTIDQVISDLGQPTGVDFSGIYFEIYTWRAPYCNHYYAVNAYAKDTNISVTIPTYVLMLHVKNKIIMTYNTYPARCVY
jgi:hypothetical protein